MYFVIPLSGSNAEKYAQGAFLREMELLDHVGTSEPSSDQLPPKYPLSEPGGAMEDLNVFTCLRKLQLLFRILAGRDTPPPFLPLTVRTYYHHNCLCNFVNDKGVSRWVKIYLNTTVSHVISSLCMKQWKSLKRV